MTTGVSESYMVLYSRYRWAFRDKFLTMQKKYYRIYLCEQTWALITWRRITSEKTKELLSVSQYHTMLYIYGGDRVIKCKLNCKECSGFKKSWNISPREFHVQSDIPLLHLALPILPCLKPRISALQYGAKSLTVRLAATSSLHSLNKQTSVL